MVNGSTYFNDLLVRLEEILFHELSGCARPKVELVGTDFLKDKIVTSETPEGLVTDCIREIKAAGLCEDLAFLIAGHGVLLKLTMKGCIHMPKEIRLKEDGVEPYMCPIANMILDRILEVLHYTGAYTAKVQVDEKKGECVVKCAIYESVDKIGQVSDWTSI